MKWRAKLQEQRGAIFQKMPGDSLPKLTKPKKWQFDSLPKLPKPGFVGFGSDPSGHSVNINAAALKTERARLLTLASAEWIDAAHVHRLQDADLACCLGLDDCQRATFLRMLADSAERHAGRASEADTAAMYCRHCGPVWIHPDIAAVLPVVGRWPRALGCPWCFVRKAGGVIPRPPVTCTQCQHFTPGKLNPMAGMGTCCDGSARYPMTSHHCTEFSISAENGDLA